MSAVQAGWCWCSRCQSLVFSGFGSGVCHDGNPHYLSDSGPYSVPFGATAFGAQEGWRWCSRCQVLVYGGFGSGICHDGKPHHLNDSGPYSVPFGDAPYGAQDGWRWCSRCQVLVYGGFGSGVCHDGNPHYLSDSGPYSLPFSTGGADRVSHRFAIATFLFRSVLPDATGNLPWSRDLMRQVFVDHEYSVRNYWHRATCGLVDLQFDIVTPLFYPFEEYSQAEAQGRGGRNRTLDAARGYLADNGISLDGYDHLIVAVPTGPTDAGATGGDIAFDLAGASLAFLQHEVGHTLGFQHAFGPLIPPPDPFGSLYNDAYCVMGYTGPQSHAVQVPPISAGMIRDPAGFWRSERRVSAASLLRHSVPFRVSGRVTQIRGLLGGGARVFALAGTSSPPDAQLAVIRRPRHPNQYLTVEYRTATADDAGVNPAVVIHSIGAHDVGPGRGEVDPSWLETAIPATPGSTATVLGIRFVVRGSSPTSVDIDATPVPTP
ncbi:hypothetical protein [Actinocorallia longicatena]|uniref:Uncharacterized protein n=1 Tax=Actinocorallia longicatena TaxID=111803 RepID=A0ABP6PVX8_9ACTN